MPNKPSKNQKVKCSICGKRIGKYRCDECAKVLANIKELDRIKPCKLRAERVEQYAAIVARGGRLFED